MATTVQQYSRRSIWIHWASAILILLTIPTGLAMSETETDATKMVLYQIHFIIGGLVFLLAVFHVYVYFKDVRPAPIDTGNKRCNQFIAILHRLLTILIIVLTLTGILGIFDTVIWEATLQSDHTPLTKFYDSIFITMHHIQGLLFTLLVILHIGGVLLHRFTKNKTILSRMGLKI